MSKLFAIKLLHSAIWLILASATCYVFYSGASGRINLLTWIAIAMIIAEAIVLIVFKWVCPLTLVARKYSNSQKENFDIFLPNIIAKYNKTIFTSIFLAGLILIFLRMIS